MKNLILILVLLLSFSISAQKITKKVDDMTDKVTYHIDSGIVLLEETRGFIMMPMLYNKKGRVIMDALYLNFVGLDDCNENNELIFMFEDDSKLTLKANSKFNCKAYSIFTLRDFETNLLLSNRIKKIRFTNGFSYKSATAEPESKDVEYFMRVEKQLKIINR